MCITQLFILYNDFHQKQKAEQLEYETEFISYKLLYNLLIDSPLDILLIVEKKKFLHRFTYHFVRKGTEGGADSREGHSTSHQIDSVLSNARSGFLLEGL